ncbi:YqhR family membrane protein [Natribacillus halophilus]|uniref:Conserved membrane protein YqhR n=1 Tax=Natribacillus halophilus TaxID=549003 RepID=A0A1G8JMN5_9BACI|nr:YqhR family membrane protein [Natribacillus halophilus]SDI31890.1 Conserved membrane protein YqhR [Natribacillus halophilus]
MNRKHKEPKGMPFAVKVLLTGVFGGLIWSCIWYVAYFFNFTDVGPALIWMAWALGDWTEQMVGQWTAVGIITVLSIGVAFLYRFVLVRVRGMWMGLLFGAVLWGLVFFVANPLFVELDPLFDMEGMTIVTTLCLFIMYGVFIGYSISYEYELLQFEKRG